MRDIENRSELYVGNNQSGARTWQTDGEDDHIFGRLVKYLIVFMASTFVMSACVGLYLG